MMNKRFLFIFSIITFISSIITILIILQKLDFKFEITELTLSMLGAGIGVLLSFLLSLQLRKRKSKMVLLTYSNADLEEALKINNYLSERKINSSLIDYYYEVGKPISNFKEITKNIDIIIVIISKDIHKAKNIKNIISLSISQKKKILPLVVDDTKLPSSLSNYNYIDVSNNENLALNDLYEKILSL